MSQYVLIKGCSNYSDEFDCEFFRIELKDKWVKFQAIVEKYFSPFKIWFGTNESVEFQSYQHWCNSFVASEISEHDYNFLKGKFGTEFGTGSNIVSDDILDNLEFPEEIADDYFSEDEM